VVKACWRGLSLTFLFMRENASTAKALGKLILEFHEMGEATVDGLCISKAQLALCCPRYDFKPGIDIFTDARTLTLWPKWSVGASLVWTSLKK